MKSTAASVRSLSSVYFVFITIFSSFLISCGESTKRSGPLSGDAQVTPTIPEEAMSGEKLKNYFSSSRNLSILSKDIYLFSTSYKGGKIYNDEEELSKWGEAHSGEEALVTYPYAKDEVFTSNLTSQAAPECQHYNSLYGKPVFREDASCKTTSDWTEVKDVLNSCRGSGKKLVLDLNVFVENSSTESAMPQIVRQDGHPFPVFAFCIQDSPMQVTVLNPEYLDYEIISASGYQGGQIDVRKMSENPGWFMPSFIAPAEGGRLASDRLIIRLKANQRDATALTSPLPSVRVSVIPQDMNARMGEHRMSIRATDNTQEPMLGGHYVGPVNALNGEVVVSHMDSSYETPQLSMNLGVLRTYRSFNNSAKGDFGWHWAWKPSKERYHVTAPMGALDSDVFEFIDTGEGRKLSPSIWPYWGEDDEARPIFSSFWTGLFRSSFDLTGRPIQLMDGPTGNALFYFHSGSQIRLIADTLTIRNSRSNIKLIVDTFKTNAPDTGSNPNPATDIATAPIRNALAGIPGNFLYVVRNKRGYVQAVVDKLGFFSWYTYGDADGTSNPNGDYLLKVERFVHHNPDGASAGVAEDMELYSYTYWGDSLGDEWSGLLKTFKTYHRDTPSFEAVAYAVDENLFGSFPLITEFKVAQLTHELEYDFEGFYEEEEATAEISHSIVYPEGDPAVYTYITNDRGYLLKIRGPSETSDDALLYEARYSKKLNRLVSEWSRGESSAMKYSEKFRAPKSSSACLDSSINSTSFSGSTGVALGNDYAGHCAGSSRQTEFAKQQIQYIESDGSSVPATEDSTNALLIEEWYRNLSGQVIPGHLSLPAFGGSQLPQRVVRTTKLGCAGGSGQQTLFESQWGSYCEYQSDSVAGKIPVFKAEDKFRDGSVKRKSQAGVNSTTALPFSSSELPNSLIPVSQLKNLTQVGYFTNFPTLGYTEVYDGGSELQDLTTMTTRLFDATGGIVVEKNSEPWNSYTYYFYNYLSPVPTLTAVLKAGLKPANQPGGINTIASVEDFEEPNWMSYPGVPASSSVSALADELFNRDAASIMEAPANFVYLQDVRLGDKLRIEKSFSPDGVETTYNYDHPTLTHLPTSIVSKYRKSADTSDVIEIRIERDYDDVLERVLEENVYDVNAQKYLSKTKYFYREDNDRGLYAIEKDQTTNGGLKTRYEILSYTYGGLVKEDQVKVLAGTTSAPKKTKTTYTYTGYGEIQSRTEAYYLEVSDSSPASSETWTYTYDPATGVLLTEQRQKLGDRIDERVLKTDYINYDKYLTPLGIFDSDAKILTAFFGVPGKEEEVRIFGPDTLGGAINLNQSKHHSALAFDGCGNQIERNISTRNGPLGESTTIEYGNGLCLPSEIKHLSPEPDSPYVWKTSYGYRNDGVQILGMDIDNAASEDGSKVVHGSVLDCPRDSVSKRCTGPGTSIDYNMGGRVREFYFTMDHADKVWRSPIGKTLKSIKWIADRMYTETYEAQDSSEGSMARERSGSSSVTQFQSDSTSTLSSSFINQFRNGNETYSLESTFDAGTGAVVEKLERRQNPLHGSGSAREQITSQMQYDHLGRMISTHIDVRKETQQGSSGWDRLKEVTYDQNPNLWSFGIPKKAVFSDESLHALYEMELQIGSFSSHLPATSSISSVHTRNPNSSGTKTYPWQASRQKSYDGLGRILSDQYVQQAFTTTNHGSTIRRNELTSEFEVSMDEAGRIDQQVITLNDVVPSHGGSTPVYGLNGGPIISQDVISGSQDLEVTYDFHVDGFTMNYEGYEVRYYVNRSKGMNAGRVESIIVNTPGSATFSYDVQGESYSGDPYTGLVDMAAGQFLLPSTSTAIPWWDHAQNGTSSLYSLLIRNRGNPSFSWLVSPGVYLENRRYQDFNFSMDEAVPYSITHHPDYIGSGDFIYVSPAGTGTIPVNSTAANSGCDLITPDHPSKDYSAPASNADEYLNLYDERNSLAFARRFHRFGEAGVTDTEEYRTESIIGYDVNKQAALIQELLYYRKIDQVSWSTEKLARVIKTARFSVPSPRLSSFAHAHFVLKEIEYDSAASRLSLVPDAFDMDGAVAGSTVATERVFVYGPMGPIMAFETRNGDVVMKEFIYDRLGNIRTFREVENAHEYTTRQLPYQEAIYGPYSSSIQVDYGASTGINNLTDGQKSYRTTALKPLTGADLSATRALYYRDPRNLPNKAFRIGARGGFTDVSGIVHVSGESYDAHEGRFLNSQFQDGVHCLQAGNLVAQGQALISNARASIDNPGEYVAPSHARSDLETAQFLHDGYLENYPSFFSWQNLLAGNLGAFAVKYAGLHWMLKKSGQEWYFRDQYGSVANALAGSANGFCFDPIFNAHPGSQTLAGYFSCVGNAAQVPLAFVSGGTSGAVAGALWFAGQTAMEIGLEYATNRAAEYANGSNYYLDY